MSKKRRNETLSLSHNNISRGYHQRANKNIIFLRRTFSNKKKILSADVE